MNSQRAIEIINSDNVHYMGLGDRNEVVAFARKILEGITDCPDNRDRLLASFDSLSFSDQFYEARHTMQLFVPQLDYRRVPGVMDCVQIDVPRETATQQVVFDFVMSRFRATGQTLPGMPFDLLDEAVKKRLAA